MPTYTIECDCCRAWILTACVGGRTMKVFNENIASGDVLHVFGECWTASGPTAVLTGAQNMPGNPPKVDDCEDDDCLNPEPPPPGGGGDPPVYIWKLERYDPNSCNLDGTVVYTATDLSQNGSIIRLTEYGEHCWKKSIVIKGNQELVDVTVAESFSTCSECVTSAYKLVECPGDGDILYVNGTSDFSGVSANGWGEIVDKVIEHNGQCWIVKQCSGGECEGKFVTSVLVTIIHDDCDDCNPCGDCYFPESSTTTFYRVRKQGTTVTTWKTTSPFTFFSYDGNNVIWEGSVDFFEDTGVSFLPCPPNEATTLGPDNNPYKIRYDCSQEKWFWKADGGSWIDATLGASTVSESDCDGLTAETDTCPNNHIYTEITVSG